jgi:hypothetical protein
MFVEDLPMRTEGKVAVPVSGSPKGSDTILGLLSAIHQLASCRHPYTAISETLAVCVCCGARRLETGGTWIQPDLASLAISQLRAMNVPGTGRLGEEVLQLAWQLFVEGSDAESLRRALGELRLMSASRLAKGPDG